MWALLSQTENAYSDAEYDASAAACTQQGPYLLVEFRDALVNIFGGVEDLFGMIADCDVH